MTTISTSEPVAARPIYASLFVQVLAALLLGIFLGMAAPNFAIGLKIFSDAFLKLISMIVAPIVFCVVVHGIAGAGDLKKVGRVGIKALVYFEVMTTIALLVGLALAYLFGPGHGMNIDPSTLDARALSTYADNAHKLQGEGVGSFLLNIIPTTSFDALARNDVLQVLFFAVIFGVSLALVGGEKGERISAFIDAVSTVLFRAMGLIVRVAPLGVLGAVAYTVGKYGVGSLKQLMSLVVLFYVSVAIFVFAVLGSRHGAGGTQHPQIPVLSARGTDHRARHGLVGRGAAADHAQARAARRQGFGRRPRYSDRLFVQSRRLLDLPDAGRGVHRAGDQHAAVASATCCWCSGVSLITSKGAHGVPGSAIVILAATLKAVPSIPAIGLVLVLSVDWFIGMARALGNLIGNCVATVVVAAWEGDLDRAKAVQVLDGNELVDVTKG